MAVGRHFGVVMRLVERSIVRRLLNIGLRGLTLASKFLLVLFLAKFLEPSDLGLYGLVVASISYALYLVGLDFYTFTTRELIKREPGAWGDILKNQVVLSLILYVVFVPVVSLLFIRGVLPSTLIAWFFGLLLLEHLAQELNRILVALSAQLVASAVLFLRAGMWAIVAVTIMVFDPRTQNLQFVLLCWTLGGVSACLVALTYITNLKSTGWRKPLNWGWIRTGVGVALPFLLATLAARGIFTFDRYWLEHLAGLEVLGAYVLFMNISNALISFLDAGVFVYVYPSLIAAYNSGRAEDFRVYMRKLVRQCLLICIVFCAVAVVMVPHVIDLLGKPIYQNQSWMFPWVLLATVVFSLGLIPQYGLYAQGKDKHIIMSHIAGFVAFVLVVYGLSGQSAGGAVLAGLIVSFGISAIWKSLAYALLTPPEYLFYKRHKRVE